MIRIKNLTKKYGEKTVFDNFSVCFESGKTTCILGESGSGKTTLLNVLASLTEYSGEVDKVNSSIVFQTPNLFLNLTAKENISLVCDDEKAILDLAKEFLVQDKLSSYPKHLSGGEAQRMALIRGMCYKADLLLMDEPFSSLDLRVKHKIMAELKKRLKKEQKTCIMVTHDIREAVTMADRIIVLKSGEVVYDNNEITEKTEKELFGLMIKE